MQEIGEQHLLRVDVRNGATTGVRLGRAASRKKERPVVCRICGRGEEEVKNDPDVRQRRLGNRCWIRRV